MRKTSILVIALVALAVMAVPASASVQNIKISGSIDSTYINRNNLDFGEDDIIGGDQSQSTWITQTILAIAADLTEQVSAGAKLINERGWDADGGSSGNTDVRLMEAWLQITQALYSPLTVIIGRQSFGFGNDLIFNTAGTNNSAPGDSGINNIAEDLTKQTTMDAIRAILDYNPLTVTLFWAMNAQTTPGASTNNNGNDAENDVHVFGANANYQVGDDMGTEVETYFFAKVDGTTNTTGGTGSKNDTIYIPGIRVSTNPLEGLNTQVEFAQQFGTDANHAGNADADYKRNAQIAQAIVHYQVGDLLGGGDLGDNTTAQYVYTWASGDADPNDSTASGRTTHAWDPFFENQGGGTLFNAIFNLTNIHVHQLQVGTDLMEDVRGTFTWSHFTLDKDWPSVGAPGSIIGASPNGGGTTVTGVANNDELGQEFQTVFTYDYTEDVQFGANFSWFIPGDAVAVTAQNTASQALVNVNVNF